MDGDEIPRDLQAMGRQLDRAVRRDAAAGEQEARSGRLASRSLVDVAWDAMQRGDAVAVQWLAGQVRGAVTAAVGDLVVVDRDGRRTGVWAECVARLTLDGTRTAPSGSGDRSIPSFQAWVRYLEGARVRVYVVGEPDPVDGVLVVAATDHLLLTVPTAGEIALASTAVAAVAVESSEEPVMRGAV